MIAEPLIALQKKNGNGNTRSSKKLSLKSLKGFYALLRFWMYRYFAKKKSRKHSYLHVTEREVWGHVTLSLCVNDALCLDGGLKIYIFLQVINKKI